MWEDMSKFMESNVYLEASNIMTLKFFLAFLAFPMLTLAQTSYKGTVINKKSKETIPYATVGLIKENTGINADEEGKFILKSLNPQKNDTLIISSIGYELRKIPLEINKTEYIIGLNEKITKLGEILVTNKTNWSTILLNDFDQNKINHFITSSGFHLQMAQLFEAPTEFSKLEKVKIFAAFKQKTKFRIRIYNIDLETKSPSNDLCNEIIEIQNANNKVIEVDVSKYNIVIPQKEFFVSIEWLKIPFNERKIENKNGKTFLTTYSPAIGWSNRIGSKRRTWALDYSNKWTQISFDSDKTDFAISATVKY
jgi:hypothetical protein